MKARQHGTLKEAARRTLPWLPALAWMGVIYSLSAQPAPESASLSIGLSDLLLETIKTIQPKIGWDPAAFNETLRTAAHFGIYLILGGLLIPAVRSIGWWKGKEIPAALVLGTAYAISDELHQLFVPGRGAQLSDVLVDAAGTLTGALLAAGLLTLAGRWSRKKTEDEEKNKDEKQ